MKQTVTGLSLDLKAANAEASRYLSQLGPLRTENEALRKENAKQNTDLVYMRKIIQVMTYALASAYRLTEAQ